jgi:uncharacterized membrane protein YdjX (TVP38/TMEM64 family)
MPASHSPRAARPHGIAKWKVGLLAALGVLVALFYDELIPLLERLLQLIEGLGPWGPLLYILLYGVATVALIPGSILTLFAGASFGVVWGSLWTSLAATFGAGLAFLVGRYVARSWVSQKIAGNRTFRAIDDAVAKEGWKIVGLTRLSPVFPFTLLNYAFGLTRVSFRDYLLASWIGMIPGTILYVYVGSVGRAVTEAGERSTAQWVLFAVGLLATLLVTVVITRSAKRALAAMI